MQNKLTTVDLTECCVVEMNRYLPDAKHSAWRTDGQVALSPPVRSLS